MSSPDSPGNSQDAGPAVRGDPTESTDAPPEMSHDGKPEMSHKSKPRTDVSLALEIPISTSDH